MTDLLRRQHEEAKELIEQIRDADVGGRAAIRARLVAALRGHTAIEEELFYPRLERDHDLGDVVADSFRQHEELKDVLGELERCDPDDAEFADLVDELEHVVAGHIEDEEGDLLPRVEAQWPLALLDRLGAEMLHRYEELARRETQGPEIYV